MEHGQTISTLWRILSNLWRHFFSDRLKIEGSNIVGVDLVASNGVIHVLENVVEIDKNDVAENGVDVDAVKK